MSKKRGGSSWFLWLLMLGAAGAIVWVVWPGKSVAEPAVAEGRQGGVGPAPAVVAPASTYTPAPRVVFVMPPVPEPAPVVVASEPRPAAPVLRPKTTASAVTSSGIRSTSGATMKTPAVVQPKAVVPPSSQAPSLKSLFAEGSHFVVRGKVARPSGYYFICSLMDRPVNYGFRVTRAEYDRASVGLLYHTRNMTTWEQVSRIE